MGIGEGILPKEIETMIFKDKTNIPN